MRHFAHAMQAILMLTAAPVVASPTTIEQMVGCFEVVYRYIEDGEHDRTYAPVLEEAVLASKNPLEIQRNLLIFDGKSWVSQQHWHERWSEPQPGVWQQEVTGPFGDFRYQCEGTWHKGQWQCQAQQAAKPRRDKDRPYEYLNRVNILQVNMQRWSHTQLNTKITTDGIVYATETGFNTYERLPAERCQVF